MGLIFTAKKLYNLLTTGERRRAKLIFCMVLGVAFFEMLGVASILPFVAVLADPELLKTNLVLSTAFSFSGAFGIVSDQQFMFMLGLFVFFLLLATLGLQALVTYVQVRFALMREYSIGRRLFMNYLYQDYSWFLNSHSADLSKTILSEVGTVVRGGMLPLFSLMSQSAVIFLLVVMLFMVDPILALSIGGVLGLTYSAIYLFLRDILNNLGNRRSVANEGRYKVVDEAFGAIKEMKVNGLEAPYIARFFDPALTYARSQSQASVIGQLPRFALEAVAFGGMLIIILYLMMKSGSFSEVVPILALYTISAYRLLPAIQKIYSALSQLRFVEVAINDVYDQLKNLNPHKIASNAVAPMRLTEGIYLHEISYTYPNATKPAIRDINMEIGLGNTIGIVGVTGSGKTTLVDVILGLIKPSQGSVRIDGEGLTGNNLQQWQHTIGYVPQQIFIADASVGANIALGVDNAEINYSAVQRAAKIADIHDFISSELPDGYQTEVGERGIRLSGGQRQRIGIARAIYRNPQVLVLDEATSALDPLTEKKVMESIQKLRKEITTIIIAHRLTTVRNCDKIFLMEGGNLEAQGTFDELNERSLLFKSLAR